MIGRMKSRNIQRTAHRRAKAALVLAIAAVTAVACSSSPTGRSQMIFKSDEALEAEAAKAFAEYRATYPLETDRATIDYVHCVATAVVDSLEPDLRNKNWEMSIFDDDTVQAFAMPGGKIGVHNGLLKAAQNQDQLAAVIGHEIAHVTSRHMNEDVSRSMMSGVGIQVMAIVLGGGHSGATYTAYEALQAGAVLGLNLPFSRAQETEADVVGLQYMANAGFDPRESVPLWQHMMAEAGGEAPPEFLSTHPSGDTRIDSLVSQWSSTLPLYNEAIEAGRRPNCVPPAEKIEPE